MKRQDYRHQEDLEASKERLGKEHSHPDTWKGKLCPCSAGALQQGVRPE